MIAEMYYKNNRWYIKLVDKIHYSTKYIGPYDFLDADELLNKFRCDFDYMAVDMYKSESAMMSV